MSGVRNGPESMLGVRAKQQGAESAAWKNGWVGVGEGTAGTGVTPGGQVQNLKSGCQTQVAERGEAGGEGEARPEGRSLGRSRGDGWNRGGPGGGEEMTGSARARGGGNLLCALVAKTRGQGRHRWGKGLASAGHAGRSASVREDQTQWQGASQEPGFGSLCPAWLG